MKRTSLNKLTEHKGFEEPWDINQAVSFPPGRAKLMGFQITTIYAKWDPTK